LKLLRFIYARTSLGEPHDAIIARVTSGELSSFDWSLPEPQTDIESDEATTGQLVPLEQVRAVQALLADARQRETEAKEQAQAQLQSLQDEVRRLTLELGQAQGELTAVRRRRPLWWSRIFGE
jgi:hypothetical protein